MTYHGLLGQYMLPPTSLMASGKLVALDGLLKDLKAAGSRPLIFSQVRWWWSSQGCTVGCCLAGALGGCRLDLGWGEAVRLLRCTCGSRCGH